MNQAHKRDRKNDGWRRRDPQGNYKTPAMHQKKQDTERKASSEQNNNKIDAAQKTKEDHAKQNKMHEMTDGEEATTTPEPDSEEERKQEYDQHEPDTLEKQ